MKKYRLTNSGEDVTPNGADVRGSRAVQHKRGYGGKDAAGNFLSLLLGAKDEKTKKPLSDKIVTAQGNTFFLAGYETTANALSFVVYCLSTNREAEAKLLKEVDAFYAKGDNDFTVEDLEEKVGHERVKQFRRLC